MAPGSVHGHPAGFVPQKARLALSQKKTHSYENEEIAVEFDPVLCIHAAECVRGLPEVFDPKKRPWVDPDGASAEAVTRVIERCPSGALRYRRKDGGPAEEVPSDNRVTLVPDGPIYVHGQIILRDAEGELIARETRAALCRCGASANKPYCDGQHEKARFEDDGSLEPAEAGPNGQSGGALEISLAPNGPLLMKGSWKLDRLDRNQRLENPRGAFCRCGASARRPLCDGSHGRSGFQG
jgi:CDGSH-type Zn-finger protein/uncharacterized Fe-S cluster protein YjdI